MATAAEPRPASLPLPGGRRGAAVRLHPMLCGTMKRPPANLDRDEGRLGAVKALGLRVQREHWVEVPVVAFLVEHPGAGAMLVDTGFHPSVAVDPKQAIGSLGGLFLKDIEMLPEQAVPEQLRDRGVEPDSIRTVAMTHLHADHASGIAAFPDATFVVSSREWEAASKGRQPDGYVRRQYDHAFDWCTLDFDGQAADSFATFGRSLDLFGDGSVRVVFTPGHTHGHCSVVLRLARREVLITGDAADTQRTISESHLPRRMEDEHLFRRSLGEIQRYIEHTPDVVVIPGHDMDAWRRLDSLYE